MIMDITNNLQVVQDYKQSAPRAFPGKGKSPTDSDFAAEMTAQAGALAQVTTPAAQLPQAAAKVEIQAEAEALAAKDAMKLEAAKAGEAALLAGKTALVDPSRNALQSTAADRSELTQKPAASANTANAIAGLKPWTKDWVFTGMENPDLKGLLSGTDEKSAPQLQGAQALDLRQTRGDARTAKQAAQMSALMSVLSGEMPAGTQPEGTDSSASLQAGAMPTGGPVLTPKIIQDLNGLVPSQTAGAQAPAYVPGYMKEGYADTAGDLISSRLGEMNGVIDGPAQPAVRKPIQNSLSGAEYLTTLNAVRSLGGESSTRSQAGAGEGGESGLGARNANLKVIEGGAKGIKKSQFGEDLLGVGGPGLVSERSSHLSQPAGLQQGAAPGAGTEVTARVVKGAMAKDRLDSASLQGLTAGIRNLAPNGGGEIRVRLKPENLGELHIRIATQGNQVGLQIQASDEQAKKVIEESLGHLKESLAGQGLNLGSTDLSVTQAGNTAQGGDLRQDGQSHNPFAQSDMLGQNAGQSNHGGSDRWDNVANDFASRPNALSASASAATLARSGSSSSNGLASQGRLDVRA